MADLNHLNYVPLVTTYNGTGMTGGDSLNTDLNIWYEVWPWSNKVEFCVD